MIFRRKIKVKDKIPWCISIQITQTNIYIIFHYKHCSYSLIKSILFDPWPFNFIIDESQKYDTRKCLPTLWMYSKLHSHEIIDIVMLDRVSYILECLSIHSFLNSRFREKPYSCYFLRHQAITLLAYKTIQIWWFIYLYVGTYGKAASRLYDCCNFSMLPIYASYTSHLVWKWRMEKMDKKGKKWNRYLTLLILMHCIIIYLWLTICT